MATENHMGAAVLVHVARRRRLDSDLDEQSFISCLGRFGEHKYLLSVHLASFLV